MPTTTPSLERITQLKAEIANLEQAAISELMERRNAITHELATVDAEIARLTGKSPEGTEKAPRRTSQYAGKQISFELLKSKLADFPGKTMSIRKEGYDTKQIKSLVAAHPDALMMSGKGAWPMVTLLK